MSRSHSHFESDGNLSAKEEGSILALIALQLISSLRHLKATAELPQAPFRINRKKWTPAEYNSCQCMRRI